MFKENLREGTFESDKEFAKTIQEIEQQQNKASQDKNIFFKHPLKTVDATLNHIQGRGFRHLEKNATKEENLIQPIKTDKVEHDLQTDAPTLKDIQSHMGKLDLQK